MTPETAPKYKIIGRGQSLRDIGHGLREEDQLNFFQTTGKYGFNKDRVAVDAMGRPIAMVGEGCEELLRDTMARMGYEEEQDGRTRK
jgi:hypothetical protein